MNKRGQQAVTLGVIMSVFIGVLVGVILFTSSAQQVGDVTNTVTIANTSIGTLTESQAAFIITDYKSIASVVIYNATGDLVPAANYTIENNIVDDGQEKIRITNGVVNTFSNDTWNISGTAQPLTYDDNAGARTMADLIILFFGLAIAMFALFPVLKGGLDKLSR